MDALSAPFDRSALKNANNGDRHKTFNPRKSAVRIVEKKTPGAGARPRDNHKDEPLEAAKAKAEAIEEAKYDVVDASETSSLEPTGAPSRKVRPRDARELIECFEDLLT